MIRGVQARGRMMADSKTLRTFYKYDFGVGETIETIIQKRMRERLRILNSRFFDERNPHSYSHGHQWATIDDNNPAEMKSSAAETVVYHKDIIDHNV